MTTSTAYVQFERFRNQDYSLQDKPKSGRPTEINLDELKQLIESDPTLTTYNVASKLGCTQPAVHYHFKRIRLVSKLGKWVLHNLSKIQMKKRVDYCQKLLPLRRNTKWLDNLITGVEKWMLYTNTVRNLQPKFAAKIKRNSIQRNIFSP